MSVILSLLSVDFFPVCFCPGEKEDMQTNHPFKHAEDIVASVGGEWEETVMKSLVFSLCSSQSMI